MGRGSVNSEGCDAITTRRAVVARTAVKVPTQHKTLNSGWPMLRMRLYVLASSVQKLLEDIHCSC